VKVKPVLTSAHTILKRESQKFYCNYPLSGDFELFNEQKRLPNFLDDETHKKYRYNDGTKGPPKSREDLINRLMKLKQIGWIQTRHQVNDGLVGNTLEDFLNIKENNLTVPDAGRYELKAQRMETSSLTTLFHFDPYPRRPLNVIMQILGPIYGWPHEELKGEWSFRITMYGNGYTNRGFKVAIDEEQDRLVVEFSPERVDDSNKDWLSQVIKKGGQILKPQPYWPLDDLKKKAQKKITKTIYVHAEARKKGDFEEFKYDKAILYEGLDFEKFKKGLTDGQILVDFDARTGHNHGTKFRIRQGTLQNFFAEETPIF
jgi:hypothetical protein